MAPFNLFDQEESDCELCAELARARRLWVSREEKRGRRFKRRPTDDILEASSS